MATTTDNLFTLWSWPLQLASYASDLAETAFSAQQVIAVRMPMIAAAMQDPHSSNRPELRLMVSEKAKAFGTSHRSFESAALVIRRVSESNARFVGQIAGGGLVWPSQWARLFKENVAAAATMVALPGVALAPLRQGATANARRLGRGRSKAH